MISKRFILFVALIHLAGCSHLHTGRSFLSEMSHDDSRFFNPNQDFPVVSGDTGRYWNSAEEQKQRTPASEQEFANDKRQRALEQELYSLENAQSDDSLMLYDQHKHHLKTISEKIYFLNLHPFERRDYLLSRGFIQEKRAPASFFGASVVQNNNVVPGMSKDDVRSSWGPPLRVEIAGNPRYENERWLYDMNGASKYIYFESGTVQGWD